MEVSYTATISERPSQDHIRKPKSAIRGGFKVNHSADILTFSAAAEATFLVALESQQINKREKLPPPSLVADHACRS